MHVFQPQHSQNSERSLHEKLFDEIQKYLGPLFWYHTNSVYLGSFHSFFLKCHLAKDRTPLLPILDPILYIVLSIHSTRESFLKGSKLTQYFKLTYTGILSRGSTGQIQPANQWFGPLIWSPLEYIEIKILERLRKLPVFIWPLGIYLWTSFWSPWH